MAWILLLISFIIILTLLFQFKKHLAVVEQLKQKENRQRQYLEMLVHDMKNPLSAAKSSLELLIDPEMSEELGTFEKKKYINISLDSINRVFAMVLNSLYLAKYQGGELTVNSAPTDLIMLIEDTKKTFQTRLQLENKEILFYPPESVGIVNLDPELIKRVMENIISNALRHTKDGKGRVEINLNVNKEENCFAIKIIDNGEGMEQTDLSKVFDAFIKLNTEKRKDKFDTGIGLTFCKLAVEAHHGEIEVKSTKGVGTVFIIKLPFEA